MRKCFFFDRKYGKFSVVLNESLEDATYWSYPEMKFTEKMCERHGDDGSLRIETQFGLKYYIDEKGVFGTLKSLRIESAERITTASDVVRRGPFTFNGPEYNVAYQCEDEAAGSKHKTPHDVADVMTCKRAQRVTYFYIHVSLRYRGQSEGWNLGRYEALAINLEGVA